MAFDAPGVSIRYVTDGPLTVRAESTSTAVFIGPTIIGRTITGAPGTPTVTAKLVSSLTEYASEFSTAGARAGVVSMPPPPPPATNVFTDTMGHAVRGFFMNGGQNAYIVSTSRTDAAIATGVIRLTTSGGDVSYRIDALSAGVWGNSMNIGVTASRVGADFLDVEITQTLIGEADAPVTSNELFIGIDANAVETIQAGTVTITKLPDNPAGPIASLDVSAAPGAGALATNNGNITGGTNASASLYTDFNPIFEKLKDIDDISLIVLPDRLWPGQQADYEKAITHCQAMKDRMVLIQLDDTTTDFATVTVPKDKYAAVYYPQANVTLPIAGGGTRTSVVNTTGHVAGIFARTDNEKGAWTAPAGTHASVSGITDLTQDISHAAQSRMNPNNINALRYISGIPTVWGARTRDEGIYNYVPVMRTAFLIADSLRTALNRVVFAKNTEVTWRNVKAGSTAFMDSLYAQQAFQGATPGQAFEVLVGLGESMTQDDIRKGLLRLTVRFRPAFPAEFIEVSIEQIFESAA